MDLKEILQQVAEGSLDLDEAERRIRNSDPSAMSWKERLLLRAASHRQRSSWMMPLIFTGLGSIFAVAGAVGLFRSWDFASRGIETDGIVVNRVFTGGEPNEGTTPIIRYKVGDKSYEFQGRKSVAPDVGQEVRVAYLPDRPNEGQLATFQDRWMEPSMIGGLGSLFAIMGIAIFVDRQRSRG